MALIHEKLYRSDNLAQIDLAEYIKELAAYLFNSYRHNLDQAVDLQIQAEPILLGIDAAVPCGLILNEMISNAFKHAFPAHGQPSSDGQGPHSPAPVIRIELRKDGAGQASLTVADNGIGLPPGLDVLKSDSLGLQLVTILVKQLDGELAIHNQGGAAFTISFALPHS
jgi:two-component sensor histidine kinase